MGPALRTWIPWSITCLVFVLWWTNSAPLPQAAGQPKPESAAPSEAEKIGWKQGEGWQSRGKADEQGALNVMNEKSVLKALSLVKKGEVYDLGVTVDRNSYQWIGHSPCEIISFRSPEGIKRQRDLDFTLPEVNPNGVGWHSTSLFISDSIGTQISGLGLITVGLDNHWYNGFKEAEWGGDFGIRKCDATSIPPIVARAVLLDISALHGDGPLPKNYGITRADVEQAMQNQKVSINPGDIVFFRTGTAGKWGEASKENQEFLDANTSGITLGTAKYLVQQFGVMMIGSDNSSVEVQAPQDGNGSLLPVHQYLLVEQGIPLAKLHNLEMLAQKKIYEFCYICTTNKLRGTTGGFALRPIALR
ncbi:Cyclase [Planctomycetales bacterium 10988]|nr:Cyclase [Planctomycetales bacterium 10988]